MKNALFYFFLLILSVEIISCKHEPFLNGEGIDDPANQIIDTDAVDFVINTKACEDNVVYFENQVLTIFISNCAISGCHDAQSAEDGVVLIDYTTISKKMKAGDPNDSEYYTVLTDTQSDELMPRDPNTGKGYSLPAEQLNLIKTWIEQGVKDNFCDECDTTSYTYSGTVKTIINQNCATTVACHGVGTSYGDFTTYEGVKSRVTKQLIQKRAIVDKDMPPAAPIPDCELLLIKNWIDHGALNN